MTKKQEIISVSNLTKKINGRTILDKLSFSMEEGDVLGIIGPNGSGKSTLLKIILDLVNPSSGVCKKQKNTKTSAMLEKPGFYPDFSIEKNLKIFLANENFKEEEFEDIFNLFHLEKFKNKKFRHCSTGMKKRCELVACLAKSPGLLILDEPTNGLDPSGIMEFRNLLAVANSGGTTILLTSHILSEVDRLCTRLLFIKEGRLIDFSTKESLLHRFLNLEEAYNYFMGVITEPL